MDRQRYRLMVRLASAEESSRSGFSLSIIRKAETLYNSCADAVWYVRPDASSAGIHHRTHEIKGRTAAGREVIMADQPSAEPEEQASYPCHDPAHQHQGEREGHIHTLIHQGMAAMESERLDQANAAFVQALTLARQQQLPQWEAQALFGQGAVLDHAGKYTEAIPLFEQARTLFAEGGRVRMEANVSIFLANMLSKTGSPARALSVLQHAMQQAETGLATGVLPREEYQYGRFGLCHELGRAYRGMGQLEQAEAAYQEALSLEPLYASTRERSALYQDILLLYQESGDLDGALSFGERVVSSLDASDAQDQAILVELWFQLGIVCLRAHQYQESIHYSQQAYDAFQQLRRGRASSELSSADQAFIGRVFVNIGSAYGGLADSLSTYARVLAYWRCGKQLLDQAGAQDVIVPRDNIEGLRQVCTEQVGAGAYMQLLRASEPLHQHLLDGLVPQGDGWGPLLTSMLSHPKPPPTQAGNHAVATKTSRKKRCSTCRNSEGADEDQRGGQ
jgi:tetratricopeptide (TPR) repeat protein